MKELEVGHQIWLEMSCGSNQVRISLDESIGGGTVETRAYGMVSK